MADLEPVPDDTPMVTYESRLVSLYWRGWFHKVLVAVNGLLSGTRSGRGTPEGAVPAPIGTLFRREDGGVSTSLYIKEAGTGSTGWRAL